MLFAGTVNLLTARFVQGSGQAGGSDERKCAPVPGTCKGFCEDGSYRPGNWVPRLPVCTGCVHQCVCVCCVTESVCVCDTNPWVCSFTNNLMFVITQHAGTPS